MKFNCLLFDLDGTLVDSREDLADSVNKVLSEMGIENLPVIQIHDFIGEGVSKLLERSISAGIKNTADPVIVKKGVEIFRRVYEENCLNKTTLYDGIEEMLTQLTGFKKAVITNKPYEFSMQILHGLKILQHFEIITGGDSYTERKPSPIPLTGTLNKLGVKAESALMIGDSWVDITAGKAAGIKTCGCAYGFRGQVELIETEADYIIQKPSELPDLLNNN